MSTGRQPRPGGDSLERRSLKTLAWNRRVVVGLWYLAVYLMLLYAAFRWGPATEPLASPGATSDRRVVDALRS